MNEKKTVISTTKLLGINQLVLLSGATLYGILYLFTGQVISGLAIVAFTLIVTGSTQYFKNQNKLSICINILSYSQFFLILGFGLISKNLLATLPLVIAALAMTGLYYYDKIVLKQWIIAAVVFLVVLIFFPAFYGNSGFSNAVRGLIGTNFCILLIYFLVKWGAAFMVQSAEKEEHSESLIKQVEEKMEESHNNAQMQQAIFNEVRMRSGNLEDTSKRMLDIANVVSQSSSSQSAIIEEVLEQSNSMKIDVQATQDKTVTSRDTAMQSVEKLEQSNERMNEILIAINKIEESSEKISGIIKTIENIAFQTNILALNASVEAARAGASGKGFAVVAQEVRTLASHSSQAANDSVALVEETIDSVQVGVKLVKEAVGSMAEVIESSKYSAQIASEISDVMNIQVENINKILAQIENISTTTAQTAAIAGESTSIANEITQELFSINKAIR